MQDFSSNSTMRQVDKGELIVPGLIVAFLIAYHVQVRDVPSEVLLWPYMITIALVVMVGIVLFQVLREGGGGGVTTQLKKPAALFALSVGYLAIMKIAGYTLSSFFFLLCTMLVLGAGKKTAIVVSLSIAAILHAVMISVLGLDLPGLPI